MSLLVFDLDGTLVDTSGDIVHSVNMLLGERGLPAMKHEDVMALVGLGTPHLMAGVLDLDIDSQATESAVERFIAIYSAHPVDRSRPYPGVVETLETLETRHRLAIVSNKTQALVDATIGALDLGDLFVTTLGGTSLPRLKPHPDGILEVLRHTGVPTGDAAMVGDLPVDIAAGKAAGVHTIWASWGFARTPPRDPAPDGIIDSFPRLLDTY